MLSDGCDDTERLDLLVDELRPTAALTPDLISTVIAKACTRMSNMARCGWIARHVALMRAEAWTDAALFLIELELPMWRPRRLIYDDGEWVCSLSRYPEIPLEFDETAEARHELQAVAILLSLVEAKRLLITTEQASASSVRPGALAPAAYTFSCDNFG